MIHRGYIAIIPAEVRYADIPSGAKLLYGEITALSNEKGYCWASNSYFSELYGVSDRTIQRWINTLEKNGFIQKDIIYKEDSKEVDKRILTITLVTKLSWGGDKNVTGGGDKNVTRGGDKNVVDNNININNKKESVSKDTLEKKELLSETSSDECVTKEQLSSELKEQAQDLKVQQVVNEFNRVCKKLPKVKKISTQRKQKVKARLKVYSEEEIYKSFAKAAESRFLSGSSGWKASFDWFFDNDNNIQKVLEGNYDNSKKERPPNAFHNFKQRDYDFAELEKKMYGY